MITYSLVVSRDPLRISLTIAALNGIDIFSCDIQNSYLSAELREKIYTIAVPEFGSDSEKTMIFNMDLYGLKYIAAAFIYIFSETVWGLGSCPNRADPGVWVRSEVKPDGF